MPGVIDHDLTHHMCGHTSKMDAAAEVGWSLSGEPGVHLMHERGRLQSMPGSLVPDAFGRCGAKESKPKAIDDQALHIAAIAAYGLVAGELRNLAAVGPGERGSDRYFGLARQGIA